MAEDNVIRVQIRNGIMSLNSIINNWALQEKGNNFKSVESMMSWLQPNSDQFENRQNSHVTELSTVATVLPTLPVESKQERMRKEFEESLEGNSLQKLPSIEVLQIIEATVSPTTQSPVVLHPTSPMTSHLLTPVTQSPTVLPTVSTTSNPTVSTPHPTSYPAHPTSRTTYSTPSPSPHPEVSLPLSTNTDHLSQSRKYGTLSFQQQESPFITVPSPWKQSDKRFMGVTIRRFTGTREVEYSQFNNSNSLLFSLSVVQFYQGNVTEVTIVSISTYHSYSCLM